MSGFSYGAAKHDGIYGQEVLDESQDIMGCIDGNK